MDSEISCSSSSFLTFVLGQAYTCLLPSFSWSNSAAAAESLSDRIGTPLHTAFWRRPTFVVQGSQRVTLPKAGGSRAIITLGNLPVHDLPLSNDARTSLNYHVSHVYIIPPGRCIAQPACLVAPGHIGPYVPLEPRARRMITDHESNKKASRGNGAWHKGLGGKTFRELTAVAKVHTKNNVASIFMSQYTCSLHFA